MNLFVLPWVEITIAVPLIGAVVVFFLRRSPYVARWCLGFTLVALICSLFPWAAISAGTPCPSPSNVAILKVDSFSAPLLPLVALLHALTLLATARIKATRLSFVQVLFGEALRLATFACPGGWPLVILLVAGTLPPSLEIIQRGKSTRVYGLHMALFVVLLLLGWWGQEQHYAWAAFVLVAAILIRSGTVPGHLWVGDLFEQCSFGGALLAMTQLLAVYAAVRLVLPVASEAVLAFLGFMSLFTAVYAAGMAVVQREARRFFAYLFLSHAAMVMVGLELHTLISLTGALCLWVSVCLSLTGLGLVMRALEARRGRLNLTEYHGLYAQSPALGICFLLAGLGSVGFPGTIGFVAAELLADGAVAADLLVGVGLVLAAAINGIAILRVYFLLFTGKREAGAVPLGITLPERCAVLTITALILGGGLYPQPGIADRHAAAATIHRSLTDTDPPEDRLAD